MGMAYRNIEIGKASKCTVYLMSDPIFREERVRITFPTEKMAKDHLKKQGFVQHPIKEVVWEKTGCWKCGASLREEAIRGCWMCEL